MGDFPALKDEGHLLTLILHPLFSELGDIHSFPPRGNQTTERGRAETKENALNALKCLKCLKFTKNLYEI
jgi:hypothetical protein